MNKTKLIRQVLHQVKYMEHQKFTKLQKMTVLKNFLYEQLFKTLVHHLIMQQII